MDGGRCRRSLFLPLSLWRLLFHWRFHRRSKEIFVFPTEDRGEGGKAGEGGAEKRRLLRADVEHGGGRRVERMTEMETGIVDCSMLIAGWFRQTAGQRRGTAGAAGPAPIRPEAPRPNKETTKPDPPGVVDESSSRDGCARGRRVWGGSCPATTSPLS